MTSHQAQPDWTIMRARKTPYTSNNAQYQCNAELEKPLILKVMRTCSGGRKACAALATKQTATLIASKVI
jgi:hypothetical protein